MRSQLLLFVFLLPLITGAESTWGPTAEELDCEEAVLKLVKCCPKLVPIECNTGFACGPESELTEAQSQCVRTSTCESLRINGACSRPMAISCE